MAKQNMTIRIEPEIKKQASELFKSLGLDISTAVGLFFRQSLRCNGIPFRILIDEPNEETYKAIEAAKRGEDVFGPFDNVKEMMDSLDS